MSCGGLFWEFGGLFDVVFCVFDFCLLFFDVDVCCCVFCFFVVCCLCVFVFILCWFFCVGFWGLQWKCGCVLVVLVLVVGLCVLVWFFCLRVVWWLCVLWSYAIFGRYIDSQFFVLRCGLGVLGWCVGVCFFLVCL